MRQIAVLALVAGLSLSASPLTAAQVAGAAQTAVGGAAQSASQAVISGSVVSLGGEALTDTVVQARNLLTGAIGGSTTVAAGQFVLNVDPGSYVLEIVDATGRIVGTSSFVSATAGAAVGVATMTAATTGVFGVVGGATGLLATLGSASSVGAATTTGIAAALGTTTTVARTVTTVGAGGGLGGVGVVGPIASPSR